MDVGELGRGPGGRRRARRFGGDGSSRSWPTWWTAGELGRGGLVAELELEVLGLVGDGELGAPRWFAELELDQKHAGGEVGRGGDRVAGEVTAAAIAPAIQSELGREDGTAAVQRLVAFAQTANTPATALCRDDGITVETLIARTATTIAAAAKTTRSTTTAKIAVRSRASTVSSPPR